MKNKIELQMEHDGVPYIMRFSTEANAMKWARRSGDVAIHIINYIDCTITKFKYGQWISSDLSSNIQGE